jgi:hypothetical protein
MGLKSIFSSNFHSHSQLLGFFESHSTMVRTDWPPNAGTCPFSCSAKPLKRCTPYHARRHLEQVHVNDIVPLTCPMEGCQVEMEQFGSILIAFDDHIRDHMFYSYVQVASNLFYDSNTYTTYKRIRRHPGNQPHIFQITIHPTGIDNDKLFQKMYLMKFVKMR